MNLLIYVSDMGRRAALATALGKSPHYLWQIATGWRGRQASPALALAIERESALIGPEAVTKESLRPDIWANDEHNDIAA